MKNNFSLFTLPLLTLALIFTGCGGGGPAATDLAPVVTGDQEIDILEGVQLTNAYDASDPENAAVTLSLEGADASVMSLSTEGLLTFIK